MKIKIKLGDGSVTTVDAWWHPSCEIGAPGSKTTRPAGLWTTVAVIRDHLENMNRLRKGVGMDLLDLSPGIEALIEWAKAAEAPLEVYSQGEAEDPWRHTGNLVREIPAGDLPAA